MKKRKAILEKDLVVGKTYFDSPIKDGVKMILVEIHNTALYFKSKDGKASSEYLFDDLGIIGFKRPCGEWYLPNKNEQ